MLIAATDSPKWAIVFDEQGIVRIQLFSGLYELGWIVVAAYFFTSAYLVANSPLLAQSDSFASLAAAMLTVILPPVSFVVLALVFSDRARNRLPVSGQPAGDWKMKKERLPFSLVSVVAAKKRNPITGYRSLSIWLGTRELKATVPGEKLGPLRDLLQGRVKMEGF